MNFFKNLFNKSVAKESDEEKRQEINLPLDDLFVHNFTKKGGKFLYCLKNDDVTKNLKLILNENSWKSLTVLNNQLAIFLNEKTSIDTNLRTETTVFTTCEHLIADSGNILFSSNQLKSIKLPEMSSNFIVFATTSQLVKNLGEGLTGIKVNNKKNLPTNISEIKNFKINHNEDSFLNYGNTNTKNLYLLLLENL